MAKKRINLRGKFSKNISQSFEKFIFHADFNITSDFAIRLSFTDIDKISNQIVEIKERESKRILLHNATSIAYRANFLFKLKVLSDKIDKFLVLITSNEAVSEYANLNYKGYGSGGVSILNSEKVSRLSISDCGSEMNYTVIKNAPETKKIISFLEKLSSELKSFAIVIETELLRVDRKNEITRANAEFKKAV